MTMVTAREIGAARRRIAPHVTRTGTVLVRGCDLWVKPENLQPTGSFKVRGAVNAVARVAGAGERRAVVAESSGNHGQAVAYAAARFGLSATIIVPDTAPGVKVTAIRARGATVIVVRPEERAAVAVEEAARRKAVLIRSDGSAVIAGHGTLGLEILSDRPDVRVILVPVCNGGLLAGIAAAVKSRAPHIQVVGVEPELAADGADSFRRSMLVRWPCELTYRTTADGLRAPMLGVNAWEHIRRYVDDIVTVTEASIGVAMGVLHAATGMVAEPSGAVATAAYLSTRRTLPTGATVAVLSGGNVEPSTFGRLTGRSLDDGWAVA